MASSPPNSPLPGGAKLKTFQAQLERFSILQMSTLPLERVVSSTTTSSSSSPTLPNAATPTAATSSSSSLSLSPSPSSSTSLLSPSSSSSPSFSPAAFSSSNPVPTVASVPPSLSFFQVHFHTNYSLPSSGLSIKELAQLSESEARPTQRRVRRQVALPVTPKSEPRLTVNVEELEQRLPIVPLQEIWARTDKTSLSELGVRSVTPVSAQKADRYGFYIGEDDVDVPAPKELKQSLEYWAKAVAGWATFSEEKRRKVKAAMRKGCPDRYRAALWKRLLGASELQKELPSLYEQLLKVSSPFQSQIQKDLSRTLPNHVFFQSDGLGRRALSNVCKAYSVYRPKVGYCQAMAFVVAVLLLHMPEEEAFFCFTRLCDDLNLSGLFEPGFPLLHQFFWIQDSLMEQFLPLLYAHMRKEDISTDSYSTQWYTTLFVPSLPYEYTLKIWDLFLADGLPILFRVILSILKLLQDQLLRVDFEGIFITLRSLNKRKSIPFSADDLVRTVHEFKSINHAKIEKLEKKYAQIQSALVKDSEAASSTDPS